MEYALELDRLAERINRMKAKRVCVQLPDGLKPRAELIQRELEQKTRAAVLIWAGSCFGACDTPQGLEKLGVDLLVQFGHSEWR
jgi:2-(3-amino-3-carboxypropyl)histidine synthase